MVARRHADALADSGWLPYDTEALAESAGRLEVLAKGVRATSPAERRVAEQRAVDTAQAFLTRLRSAAPRAIRELPTSGLSIKAFSTGAPLQPEAGRVARFLEAIRPAVMALDPALCKNFQGKSATRLLDAIHADLVEVGRDTPCPRRPAADLEAALESELARATAHLEDLDLALETASLAGSTARLEPA